MPKNLYRYTLKGVLLIFVMYAAVLGFMAINENSIVFSGTSLGDQGHPIPADTATIPWDSIDVQADDGVPVFLLLSRLEEKKEAPWVIFFHGNGLLVGSPPCVDRYQILRETGFNVLAVEFRGYGMSSEHTVSEKGVYADARAGWTYLTEQIGVNPSQIVLYGWSLGSGVATHLASQVNPAGLITEGAFTALPDVGKETYPWLPVSLIMQNQFDNLDRAGSLSLPWLLLHSRHDKIIPFSHGEKLAATAKNSYLIELRGTHNEIDRDATLAALNDFFERLFRTDSNSVDQ